MKNTDNSLIVILFNIRALRKHSLDLKYDIQIFESDVLALTETKIRPCQSIHQIREQLDRFNITHKDCHTPQLSLALCTAKDISVLEKITMEEINGCLLQLKKGNIALTYTVDLSTSKLK